MSRPPARNGAPHLRHSQRQPHPPNPACTPRIHRIHRSPRHRPSPQPHRARRTAAHGTAGDPGLAFTPDADAETTPSVGTDGAGFPGTATSPCSNSEFTLRPKIYRDHVVERRAHRSVHMMWRRSAVKRKSVATNDFGLAQLPGRRGQPRPAAQLVQPSTRFGLPPSAGGFAPPSSFAHRRTFALPRRTAFSRARAQSSAFGQQPPSPMAATLARLTEVHLPRHVGVVLQGQGAGREVRCGDSLVAHVGGAAVRRDRAALCIRPSLRRNRFVTRRK